MSVAALYNDSINIDGEDNDVLGRPKFMLAHTISSDDEALAIASRLAPQIAKDSALHDRRRYLPVALIDQFSQSGLWAITVPKSYGGAAVSHVTTAGVFATLAEADPSLAQLAQNHFNDIDTLKWTGNDMQKSFFFAEALKGKRFGNAFADAVDGNGKKVLTTLQSVNGELVLDGKKFYATGALYSDWVQVGAVDDFGRHVLAFIRRNSPGLTIIDDWSGFGQRSTASGTVILENVAVEPENVIQAHRTQSEPTTNGAVSQLIHAAIDLGIARCAINEMIRFITTKSRPWADAKVERASDDILTISQVGDLKVRLHTAEALLDRAGTILDHASLAPGESSVASASIAVAESKIATTEIAILSSNKLFELSGTKSTLEQYSLDRHWRNARTHTLHDPVRWKYHAVGNYYLNHVNPERRGWI